MFSSKDIQKIDDYLHAIFPQIYEFDFGGIVLLYGGAIKNIIMNEKVKDLDFLILGDSDNKIINFINNYNLKYTMNTSQGYKILANIQVDLCSCLDLYRIGRISTDYLFYDIQRKQMLSVGFIKALNNNALFDYYYHDQEPKQTKKREIKAEKYMNYFSKEKFKIKRYYCRWYELSKYFIKKVIKKLLSKM